MFEYNILSDNHKNREMRDTERTADVSTFWTFNKMLWNRADNSCRTGDIE